jgi:hypothetical protein
MKHSNHLRYPDDSLPRTIYDAGASVPHVVRRALQSVSIAEAKICDHVMCQDVDKCLDNGAPDACGTPVEARNGAMGG